VPDIDGGMTRLFLLVMKTTAKQAFDSDNRAEALAISKHALKSMDSAKVTAGLTMLKAVQGVTVSVVKLDADPLMLGTPNGMIDLRLGQAVTPDRAALITKSIGVDYDPNATCPLWMAFIREITKGHQELADYLQTAVGYTLTASNVEQCLFFLYGCGANGKGTFVETITALLGDYAITAPESMFTKDRNQSATNDIARLAGCRMAVAAEVEENAHFAESRIKALTGGDTITARFLHKEFFDFRPSHHFWISGNHKPNVRGADHGIWRRIRLVPFTRIFADHEKDKTMPAKLLAELPGILNWALAGCLRWQREGLTTPACVTAATETYRAEEDMIGHFLEECTAADPSDRVLVSSFYQAFNAWEMRGGIKYPTTIREFNKRLEERGFIKAKSGPARFWKGVRLES